MTKEKMKERYERAKEAMEKAKADMERYGHEMEEAEKDDFWRTAKRHRISADDLIGLIAMREKENAALLKRAEISRSQTASQEADKED